MPESVDENILKKLLLEVNPIATLSCFPREKAMTSNNCKDVLITVSLYKNEKGYFAISTQRKDIKLDRNLFITNEVYITQAKVTARVTNGYVDPVTEEYLILTNKTLPIHL